MIVYWSKMGMKGIPIMGTQEFVSLAPGWNQVDDAKWGKARNLVLIQIANEDIKEEWQDVPYDSVQHRKAVFSIPPEDEKNTGRVIRIPVTIRDIDSRRVPKIIEKTFNPKTLDYWFEIETREVVRVVLQKQILGVKDGTIKG